MNSCVGGSSNTCIVVWKCFCKTTTRQIANNFSTL